MRGSLAFLVLATLVAVPASAAKKDTLPDTRPPIFEALVNCRTITDATERLACYDSKVAAIDEAEKNDELVLADKETMKEARRGLFGFSLPKLRLFGDGEEDEDQDEIVATIGSAYQTGAGKWTIVLEDGARWAQIDDKVINRDPSKGMEIKIRKATMGSFFANIGGQRAIRLKRVN